jgi:FlaA1/EpsC-like NDP-sugar epimerase
MSANRTSLRHRLLRLSPANKRLLQLAVDVPLIWLSLWLALSVRQADGSIASHGWLFLVAPAVAVPVFIRLGMYRAVMRRLGNAALLTIAKAVSVAALLLGGVVFLVGDAAAPMPFAVVFHYWLFCLLLLGGVRLAMRQFFTGDWFNLRAPVRRQMGLPRVAIYGAGLAGNQLVQALNMGRSSRPVAFLDDDPQLADRVIAGLPVYPPSLIERMLRDTGAEEILLAIPSATRARRRQILEMLESCQLPVRTMPDIADLASGRVKVEDLKAVDITDLLGRDPVAPRVELLEHCIRGQVVMVTGAGGSIGSELCRQILDAGPVALILFDHSEFNLYTIQSELEQRITHDNLPVQLVSTLGSVRYPVRMLEVMQSWKVDTVYHAAAYKHVPMVEHNVAEGVLNNALGTLYAAQSALRAGVRNFVLISTDKAVRPTNVMGSTKRMAELVLQAMAHEREVLLYGEPDLPPQPNRTRFVMVRFGNVLGSSGSVIPLFREQIRRGGPLTVTHPEMTRYFMTIPEAAQLVIQAGSMGDSGEVFVLDMGEPVKIAQMAEKMVHLSGLTLRTEDQPDGDIAIEFTGLRPGEKLYEELLIGDDVLPTDHPMIMRANEVFMPWEELKELFTEMVQAIRVDDYSRMRSLLCRIVSGYTPDANVDWLHCQDQDEASRPVASERRQIVVKLGANRL